jgi:thioredoxin-related protein
MNRWILLFAIALAVASAEIVKLDDLNFEHLTQASTGQTTGKWFIMLGAVWCGYACNKLDRVLEELSEIEGVVTGRVDTTASKDLSERFAVTGHPTLIYLADRKLYKYTGEQTTEAMKEFCLTGYKEQEALPVPPPPGFIKVQLKKLHKFIESNEELTYLKEDFEHIVAIRKNAAGVLLLMGAVLGFMLGCMCGCFGKGKPPKTKTN